MDFSCHCSSNPLTGQPLVQSQSNNRKLRTRKPKRKLRDPLMSPESRPSAVLSRPISQPWE
ncbi:hypothetical protein BT69DRAFT_1285864 [Atractiella rhizophila]|nr:hypothetical protein BT69DRAFT_1285864 [Atractiella rhizophila]